MRRPCPCLCVSVLNSTIIGTQTMRIYVAVYHSLVRSAFHLLSFNLDLSIAYSRFNMKKFIKSAFKSSPRPPSPPRPRPSIDVRSRCPHFRILILGRANAGKTTILKNVCNSVDDPEIFSPSGEKVSKMALECERSSELNQFQLDPAAIEGSSEVSSMFVFVSVHGHSVQPTARIT